MRCRSTPPPVNSASLLLRRADALPYTRQDIQVCCGWPSGWRRAAPPARRARTTRLQPPLPQRAPHRKRAVTCDTHTIAGIAGVGARRRTPPDIGRWGSWPVAECPPHHLNRPCHRSDYSAPCIHPPIAAPVHSRLIRSRSAATAPKPPYKALTDTSSPFAHLRSHGSLRSSPRPGWPTLRQPGPRRLEHGVRGPP